MHMNPITGLLGTLSNLSSHTFFLTLDNYLNWHRKHLGFLSILYLIINFVNIRIDEIYLREVYVLNEPLNLLIRAYLY